MSSMASLENGVRAKTTVMNSEQPGLPENSDFTVQRNEMLQVILKHGVDDPHVLHAMNSVPREEFVPKSLRTQAYEDRPLPLDHGQTISQPLTVAFMCAALELTGSEKVLEIGTGSGYGAAVLSHLARQVYTVERLPDLADSARARLDTLGYNNVHVVLADGSRGLPDFQPYDAICVTARAAELPTAYQAQLAEGGRILIPLGDQPRGQMMTRFTKRHGRIEKEELGLFSFVPLLSDPPPDDD